MATHSSILAWKIPQMGEPLGPRSGESDTTQQLSMHTYDLSQEKKGSGFPGGPVVKNLPCSAGDTTSARGPGRLHMLQGD